MGPLLPFYIKYIQLLLTQPIFRSNSRLLSAVCGIGTRVVYLMPRTLIHVMVRYVWNSVKSAASR